MAFTCNIPDKRPVSVRFAERFAAYRMEVQRRREQARAAEQLRSLDRHTLRDIAIDRSEIASVVHAGDGSRRREREDH